MQGLLVELVQSLIDMPRMFADVATNDPLAALMLLVGALLTTVSIAVFGYLTAGAALSLFTSDGGPAPPQAGR